MEEKFSRTQLLIGSDALKKLQKSKVVIFGIGGVGGYVAEALARSGIEKIDLVDSDKVCLSNINRQIIATEKTVGKNKVDAFRERILEINSNVDVKIFDIFYSKETDFDFSGYDYIVDAIDTVSSKILLIEKAKENNIPIICAMGAGNKMDATKFVVDDISKTSVCPLARVMRLELKKRNIKNVKVVYSKEPPVKKGNKIPASISFVPSVMGLIIAGEVIKDLIGYER